MAHGARCSTCGTCRSCSGVCGNCDAERRQKAKKEREDKHWWIGSPPEWDLIEKVYTEMVCGKCEPKYGRVSQRTFDAIRYSYTMNPDPPPGWTIKIFNALLIVDASIAPGYIKWSYEWNGPVPEEPKKEKTVTELLGEETKRLGQEALKRILNQCSCEICRVVRMAERPFG